MSKPNPLKQKIPVPRSLFPVPLIPMYLFTVVFVLGPLVYMAALSFMRRRGVWDAEAVFTLRNYRLIFEPVYLETFKQSVKLALVSTLAVTLAGYPFGYFMARLRPVWRGRVMLLLIIPFWTSALMRLYGWIIVFRSNGVLDRLLARLLAHLPARLGLRHEPLRLL